MQYADGVHLDAGAVNDLLINEIQCSRSVVSEGRMLSISFESLEEYLSLLQCAAVELSAIGSRAMHPRVIFFSYPFTSAYIEEQGWRIWNRSPTSVMASLDRCEPVHYASSCTMDSTSSIAHFGALQAHPARRMVSARACVRKLRRLSDSVSEDVENIQRPTAIHHNWATTTTTMTACDGVSFDKNMNKRSVCSSSGSGCGSMINNKSDYVFLVTAPRPMTITTQKQSKNRCSEPSKRASSMPWHDIFGQCRAVVSWNRNGQLHFTIEYADELFRSTFNLNSVASGGIACPATFGALVGPATCRATLRRAATALENGDTAVEFINLYRCDGVPLSCHMTLTALRGRCCSGNGDSDCWGTMVIRSASAVGNASYSGVGLLKITAISHKRRLQALDLIEVSYLTTICSMNEKKFNALEKKQKKNT